MFRYLTIAAAISMSLVTTTAHAAAANSQTVASEPPPAPGHVSYVHKVFKKAGGFPRPVPVPRPTESANDQCE